MTDPYKSLDETIAAIRQTCDDKCREYADRTLTAETRAVFLEDSLNRALTSRIAAERITMALITQFSIVEKVFSDAKEMALKVEKVNGEAKPPEPPPTTTPAQPEEPKPVDPATQEPATQGPLDEVRAIAEGVPTDGHS